MRTEEILRHEAEYRVMREALGTYLVDLVMARPLSGRLRAAGQQAAPEGRADSPASGAAKSEASDSHGPHAPERWQGHDP